MRMTLTNFATVLAIVALTSAPAIAQRTNGAAGVAGPADGPTGGTNSDTGRSSATGGAATAPNAASDSGKGTATGGNPGNSPDKN